MQPVIALLTGESTKHKLTRLQSMKKRNKDDEARLEIRRVVLYNQG